jgi:hypothetical protein
MDKGTSSCMDYRKVHDTGKKIMIGDLPTPFPICFSIILPTQNSGHSLRKYVLILVQKGILTA